MTQKLLTLSGKQRLIMEMLVTHSELYGLEMVEKSEGRLKRGTVYVTLARMEELGFVSSWNEAKQPGQIGLPRRLYRAEAYGIRVLRAHELFEGALIGNFAPEPVL